MFGYKSHPRGYRDGKLLSNIIGARHRDEAILMIRSFFDEVEYYPRSSFDGPAWGVMTQDVKNLMADASVVDAFVSLGNYQNILVVPEHDDADDNGLFHPDGAPKGHMGFLMFPAVHAINDGCANLHIAIARGRKSIFNNMYRGLAESGRENISVLDADTEFTLDIQNYRLNNVGNVKFDAVVMIGAESMKKGKYNKTDVKSKFAKYCTEDFDLIDVYYTPRVDGGRRIIKNNPKDMTSRDTTLESCLIADKNKYRRFVEVFTSTENSDYVYSAMKPYITFHQKRMFENIYLRRQWMRVY